jgi:APA family basic amino acid/polyamine antiporter
METADRESGPAHSRLGLSDATSIIVGIIIGVGIFEVPSRIFARAPGPWEALGVWLLGGALAFVGALCFAELATTYPRSGGEYVYLTRAYGPWMGFLFGWAQLTVFRTGSIAALAYIFAVHASRLWGLDSAVILPTAVTAILLLALINIVGVRLGKRTQNLLTLAKVLGVGGLVFAGFVWASPEPAARASPRPEHWFAFAMTYVLWTYSGWHEAAYVAAEVRNPRRNLPWSLLLGAALVTLIYLLVNAAFVAGLGFERAGGYTDKGAKDAAADVLALALGTRGAQALHVLVMVSALGAINGMIFTSGRIFAELGADHRLFAPLRVWSPRFGTPARALLVLSGISVTLVIGVGLWWNSTDGFDALVEATAGVFWLFFFLTGVALFLLRRKDKTIVRPFPVPGYPIVPLLFCAWCGYMVIGVIGFAPERSLLGLALLAVGVPLYFLSDGTLLPSRTSARRGPVPLAPRGERPRLSGYARD